MIAIVLALTWFAIAGESHLPKIVPADGQPYTKLQHVGAILIFFAAATVLTLSEGTIALVSNTRSNGRGHDVRLELFGSRDSVCAGLDERLPMRSADPSITFQAYIASRPIAPDLRDVLNPLFD